MKRGPWVIAATSADVDWRTATAALAAAAEVPVAVVVLGASVPGDDPARPHLAAVLELPEPGQLSLEQAGDLLRALGRAQGLVLVAAPAGLLVPLGRDGWTLIDIAAAAGAPAVVVTGPGPDSANHTALTLDALTGRGIPASVVTIGEVDEAALPALVAGRVPAAPADLTEAAGWFDPALRATPDPVPAPVLDTAARRTEPISGKRVVIALLAVFLVMVAVVCGIGWWGTDSATTESRYGLVSVPGPGLEPGPETSLPPDAVTMPPDEAEEWEPEAAEEPETASEETGPEQTAADVCPENAGTSTPTRPDKATTDRVGKAWRRIEKWLDAEAPAGARALRPPAAAGEIDDMQRRMSVTFPADLVASLRRHDGVSQAGDFSLPPYFVPESLAEIHEDWKVNCGVLADGDTDWAADWWHEDFVPFATAGDGGSLLVDQRPGGHGRVGEFYPEDGTTFDGWPASVTELLERTATSLETGKPFAGQYRPKVVDGTVDWEILLTGE